MVGILQTVVKITYSSSIPETEVQSLEMFTHFMYNVKVIYYVKDYDCVFIFAASFSSILKVLCTPNTSNNFLEKTVCLLLALKVLNTNN